MYDRRRQQEGETAAELCAWELLRCSCAEREQCLYLVRKCKGVVVLSDDILGPGIARKTAI